MRGATVINPKEVLLENILAAMDTKIFSKTLASEIVGGEKKLTALIERGEIDCVKTSNTFNGKWYCNAGHVLRHVKNMRPRNRKTKKK